MSPRLRPLLLLLLAMLCMPLRSRSQKKPVLHSPAELLKILIDSKISYEVELMDSTFPCRDRSDLLTNNFTFPSKAKESTNGYEVYHLTADQQALLDKGEDFFNNKQHEEARRTYLEMARLRPDFSPVLTYIGQTYEVAEDYSNAIKYLEDAVKANYYDYLAHYFLADDYARIGNYNRAADEIITASVLNRNNKNIRAAMKRIMPKAGYKAPQWCFEPQVLIMRKDDTHITMKFAPSWLGYAVAKAVWKFEPGYRAAAGGAPEGSYNLSEDKECLASLAAGLENDTARSWEGKPELEALMKATHNKMFTEYLFYEVMLPKFPKAVYQLPREELEDIRKYVLQVRAQ